MDFGVYLIIYVLKGDVLKAKTLEELLDDGAAKVEIRRECLKEVTAKSSGSGLVDDVNIRCPPVCRRSLNHAAKGSN